MSDHQNLKTIGVVSFGNDGNGAFPLFRVSADVPLEQALEQVSNLLHCAKHLALEAAIDPDAKRQAWASHYLCEMSKAIIDDLSQAALDQPADC